MSQHRITQLAIALFVILVIVGFSWWFLENYEQETYTAREAMSPEARRNPLLAAQHLLTRLGQQVESQSGRQFLIHPPSEPGVLLVRDLGPPLPQERVDDLLAWVEGGGHLIASVGRLQDADLSRPLLESFGVDLIRLWDIDELGLLESMSEEAACEEGEECKEAECEQTPCEKADATSILLPGNQEEPLSVEFDTDTWFEVDYPYEYWQAPAEESPHLLIFPLGEGMVTLLSDSDYFDNQRIGDSDHAPLLAELTAGYDRVWLLYSSQMPSLAQLLWRWAPYLMFSLGLLAALLIWRMSRRSGPLIVSGQQQRRDLLEHLQAAAEFNWRIDPSASLLQQARKQVEKRWMASHPQLQRLDTTARCAWLAERTGMTAEAVELALYRSQADGGQLIKITANLQRLLAALHPQSKKR
jgi:hypothetical protein